MRHIRVLGAVVVVLSACSRKADPPAAGSASPAGSSGSSRPSSTADAPAVVRDAEASAAIDATGTPEPSGDETAAGEDTAAGDLPAIPAPVPIPEALREAVPEQGILLATNSRGYLVIAKLDRSGIAARRIEVSDAADSFGWLDEKTIVTFGIDTLDDNTPKVWQLVDGKPVKSVAVPEEWKDAKLQITRTGEVWLDRCLEGPDGTGACISHAYQRIWPTKATAKKPPKNLAPARVSTGYALMGLQGPITPVAAPAGVKLVKVKLDNEYDAKILGTRCTKGKQTSTHPEVESFEYGYTAKSYRWVLAEPAIYEVTADERTPLGGTDRTVTYFRPCEDKPLDGFLGLGGSLWAEYSEAANGWTFRIGTTDIGTLEGEAIRANLF